MKTAKTKRAGFVTTTVKALLLGTFAIAVSVTPVLQSEVRADRLDKSSPKIAHGMYKDRGKSSPKIAHGMYRDRGKSSPKIAEGMYRDRGKSSPKIAHGMVDILENVIAGRTRSDERFELAESILMALEIGEVEIADELLDELNSLDRTRR